MRIVLKKHTGVMVHWGKDDTLGDVCNALETLMDKGIVNSFKVCKGSEWPYLTETPLINWEGECETVVARTYNTRSLDQLKALSKDWGDRIELGFHDGRVCLDGVSLLGNDIVVIGEKEPCTARVENMPLRLTDDALAEKFGGDRVEIVNRGHWEA